MTIRWVLVWISLVISIWFGNLALYNWWAAGGPPLVNPAQAGTYIHRGNVFFAIASLFFLVFLVLLVLNIHKRRKEAMGK